MRLLDKEIQCKGRSDVFYLYVLGDCHIGARNCAEKHLQRLIHRIAEQKNALWLGGGDYVNAIKPQDARRFNVDELPDWMFDGGAKATKDRLKDIVGQERKRWLQMVKPIKNKCIGLIQGNHELSIEQHYNEAIHQDFCENLDAPDLTDAAFVRLRFRRDVSVESVVVFICHGCGGGRTSGSEPNKLYQLAADKQADIVLRGHSHTFHIHPPIPVLYVPENGQMPEECKARYKRPANWGAWLRSWAAGAATYDSRACYPARSLSSLEIIIEPHKGNSALVTEPARISMRELVL